MTVVVVRVWYGLLQRRYRIRGFGCGFVRVKDPERPRVYGTCTKYSSVRVTSYLSRTAVRSDLPVTMDAGTVYQVHVSTSTSYTWYGMERCTMLSEFQEVSH